MNSPIYNEWVEEERREAAKEATLMTTRKYIIDLLVEKFDFVSKNIGEKVTDIKDEAKDYMLTESNMIWAGMEY